MKIRFIPKKLNFILIFILVFIYLSCTIPDGREFYNGEKVYDGTMIFDVDMSKLTSEQILTIKAKIKTLYKGYGMIFTSIPNPWQYIGNDTTVIESDSTYSFPWGERNITLKGYINSNEFFEKEFKFKIPASHIENNKLKYQFGLDFWFKYDSLYDEIQQNMISTQEYYESNRHPFLDVLNTFNFPLWF